MKTHLHLAAIFALLTLTPAAFIRAAEPGGVFKINPQATYLLIDVNGGDHALDTAPISLQSIGIQAGDFIRFRVFGAYSYGTGYADSSKLTGVVFSSSNVLLAQDQRHRVGGAIPAGTPFFSTNTYYQDQATDIPQDFVFGDGYYGDKERVVQVPAGAQYIFLAVLDGVYLDNSDPNGDYFVSIRTVPPVTVTGRVLNRKIGLGLSGATVLLAGQTTTTGGNGSFKLTNVDLLVGSELEVRADDFLPQRLTVTAGSDAKAVDVGDILLAPDTDKPVVEQVKTYLNGEGVDGGLFLAGFGLVPTLKIRVDWNGCTPGSVEVRVNGHEFATFSGAGPEYSVELPVDSVLQAALMIGNAITVTATAQEPDMVSEPFNQTLVVLPLPAALQSGSKSSFEDKLKVDLSFPVTKPFGTHNLKVFGIMGGEASVAGEFTYNYRSGKWSLEVGPKFNGESTKYSAFKLKLGPLRDVSAEVKGKANGNATLSRGIDVSGLQFSSALSLGGKYPIGSYGPLGLLGPKLTEVFVDSPGLKEAFQAVSMVIWLKPELAGEFSVAAYPTLNFEDFAFTGKTPLEAVYEPTYGKFKVKLYLGGEPSVKFALPGEFFREVRFKAYAGLEAEIWVFKRHMEYVFVNESYPAEALSPPAPLSEGSHVLAAAENETAGWKIMQRPWLDAGGEGFLPREPEAVSAMNEDTTPHAVGSGLDAFVSMGQSTGVSESKAGGAAVAMVVANDPEATVQAAFPLLSNVLPNSEPALAGKGNELMLAYVRDTGAANPVQFTEVAFSYFDGTTWTVPAPIAIDARGQFSPQVVFDGAGNAVVVFERIKDGAFSGTVMADMAALMEIVWSRWDAATQTWSVPQALTNNAYVDFSPKLSGSLADGDLLLTWNENTANQIVGTGIAGAATNLSVMTCRWDSATQTWGSAAALVPNLTGELSESLGARGNKGVYVWSVDMDGDTDNSADAELYYRLYDATTGIWSPAVRHTNDAVADRHAKVVVDAGGNVYAVWSRDGELVMDVNFVGTPSLVRGGEGTPDVADFALTAGPAGHLALVWQEMTENGSDAHYRIYDPLSSTWGLDAFLSRDSDLERSFAPVWDAAGNLTLAYNNVVITKRTVDVAVEGGGTVSVDGVPQPGRVDLLLAKRAIAKDLSVSADGLRAGSTHFLPGEVVPLTAHVFNSGNLAEQNVVVTFYDGDPASGGALIETGIVYGWLLASEGRDVTINWTVPPGGVPRTIYAVIDAQAQVTEADETNNQASLNVSGMDLEVSYRSGTVLGDGSVRVVANVKNLSSPASSRLDLDLWPEMNPGPQPLGSVTIEPLEPGESLDVTLELPPGSQGPGDKTYRLVMDEAGLAGDVEQENNEALFVLHSSAAPHIAIFNGASTAPADSNSGTFAVGHAAVGSSVAQTFTIQNTGMADLTDLAVTLVPSGSYTVSQPALNTLSPNATTTFTVTFNPTDEGFQTAVLHIASNDEAHNPLDIAVTGTGVTPLLANDIFNSRMSLGNSPTVDVSGNNAGAMMEPGESSFGGIGGASVWHEWTAPASGWVTIHTAGSSFDTVMGIFTGTTLAGLTELGHNDVSFRHADFYPGSDNPSRLVFYAEVGTIYQIVVQGRADSDFNIPAQTGDFKLHIAAEPVPPFRVTALTLAPSLADVTNGSRSVIEQIGAASSTPLAGAGSLFSVQLLRPDASSSGPWVDFSGNERVAGDASSGTYLGANSSSTAAWIPQYALAGKWSARVQCSLNGRFYRWTSPGNDLVDDNYILPPAASSTLNVINRGVVDSVPPTLVSVSGVPETPLNVGNGDVTFNIVLNIMDTLSGFNYGFVSANSASTGNTLGNNGSLASFDYFNHRTSGDQQSGTYTVPVTIPAGTANGTYYIALELNDVTFNRSDYTDNPAGDPPGTRISPPGSAVVTFQVTGGSNVPGIAVELSDGTNIGGPEVGAVAVGSAVVGQSTSRTFTVRNSGTANLTGLVLSPDLGMPNSNDFAIGVLGATTLAPGATTNFTVTFTPTALGSRIGGVGIKSNITSNDGNWNPFFIHFAGTGTASLTPREAWRQTFFGSTANSGNAADTFDYDHDGLPNLMEWACHLNPTTASTLPITATRNGASFEFTYTRSVAAVNAGAVFTVEWSDTLSNDWQVNGVTENILSDDNTVQRVKATIPAGSGSRRFAHLKVTGPP